jgi:hypothetical protein
MHPVLGQVRYSVKDKLCKHLRRCRNAGVRVRYLIIINLLNDPGRGEAVVLYPPGCEKCLP